MEHLNTETLARLVDEEPTPAETEHLTSCRTCSAEVTALREQTHALAGLPEIMPPIGDWRVLEARLRSDGLITDPGLLQRLGMAQTPPWMRAAAAILLFLGGAGTSSALHARGEGGDRGQLASVTTAQEAAAAVQVAQDGYVTAVGRYRELLAREGGEAIGGDPFGRYAALEHLVQVSQAALRQAPADPFLNGFLASALAERDATARLVSRRDNWF